MLKNISSKRECTVRRLWSRELRSFAVVGSIGFAIDAALLTLLTQCAGWTPLHARIPSFLLAVAVTWLLNRRYTFRGRGLQRRSLEGFFYLSIQLCGALLNFGMFSLCVQNFPHLSRMPVVPLAFGALAALLLNFSASNIMLYVRPRAPTSGQ